AERLLREGRSLEAAQLFSDPRRQGHALYLGGAYAEAAGRFALGDAAADHYNRGNALARAGQLEEALQAYDLALERDPLLDQARYNRERVEELLRQQEQQQRDDAQQPSAPP